VNRVRGFLDDLKTDTTIDTKSDTQITLITLCNYDKFQRPHAAADTQSNTRSNTQSDTKDKEGKERKKNTLSAEGFDQWYAVYPKKASKKAAEKAFAKVIKAALISESDLLAKTKAFAASWAARPIEDRKYIKHPATWLNGGCYDDEPDAPANQAATLPTVCPAEFDDAHWRRCLKLFAERGDWPEPYGPRPGMPGCLVPSRLIVAPVPEGSLRAAVAAPVRRETSADW
jgi:hypothetical protein